MKYGKVETHLVYVVSDLGLFQKYVSHVQNHKFRGTKKSHFFSGSKGEKQYLRKKNSFYVCISNDALLLLFKKRKVLRAETEKQNQILAKMWLVRSSETSPKISSVERQNLNNTTTILPPDFSFLNPLVGFLVKFHSKQSRTSSLIIAVWSCR